MSLHEPLPHDSAARHASGEALYIDDLPEPRDLLHAAIGLSARPHARLAAVDLAAVAAARGVVCVVTAADIPGVNDVGSAAHGDPLLAAAEVEYAGQAIFAVAAETVRDARRAARRAQVTYHDLPALLTVDDALAARSFVLPSKTLVQGEPGAAIARAPHRLSGRLDLGGQDHFYLEGQIAMALPQEGGELKIYSSTQHPTEVSHMVSRVLALPCHRIGVEVRRMGGAFGGKESQASQIACIAALLAHHTRRPVKLRLDRDDDMVLTGKRHGFRIDYEVGFDDTGRILGVDFLLAGHCGFSPHLSGPVNDRAMFHADNGYFLENARIVSHRCKTHTVSNTAFRGFGGPQGMMAIEQVIDEISRHLGRDPYAVRRVNFYGKAPRNRTPYGMEVRANPLPALTARLARTSAYARRRREIAAFNRENPWIKRGIALTPVKFGISFTLTQMNQAGALVHVYTDGTIHLAHGGTEMGQGLLVKVAQVVANEFALPLERVRITATSTEQVPNTSATAASSGSDLNGAAARAAAITLKARMARVAAAEFGVPAGEVRFANGAVRAGNHTIGFDELARLCHRHRVSLSATGFYRTPGLAYDPAAMRGEPFFYFAYGAAVAEVEIDVLSGEYRILRADLLHDCGRSLNPAIDRGQIEGGFVQGAGWLTTEELWWDAQGSLRTHAPSTYKIPACSDLPRDFRVAFWAGRSHAPALHRAKAVGEPPLMLAMSVFFAIRDAIAATAHHRARPRLDAPATPERVLLAIAALAAGGGAAAAGVVAA